MSPVTFQTLEKNRWWRCQNQSLNGYFCAVAQRNKNRYKLRYSRNCNQLLESSRWHLSTLSSFKSLCSLSQVVDTFQPFPLSDLFTLWIGSSLSGRCFNGLQLPKLGLCKHLARGQQAICKGRKPNIISSSLPPDIPNVTEETRVSNKEWTCEDIGFFDPSAEGTGPVTNVGKHVFYRDVYCFIDRLKDMTGHRGPDKLRNVIPQCLRGSALIWHSTELSDLEKEMLREASLTMWCNALTKRFKQSKHLWFWLTFASILLILVNL